jgi:hypothetical protein
MRKEKVIFDFIKLSSTEKLEFGTNVEIKLTNNPNFPTPDVSLEVLREKNSLLKNRSLAALDGGKEATAQLRHAISEWDETLRKMARYVDRIADGDGAVILSAGFNLAKQTSPGQRPEFSVELGEKSGSVSLRHQAIDGAKSYVWQLYTGDNPADESGWTVAQVTTKASVELTGLTPLTKYWFRVAAVTTDGTTAYCPPLSQVVI